MEITFCKLLPISSSMGVLVQSYLNIQFPWTLITSSLFSLKRCFTCVFISFQCCGKCITRNKSVLLTLILKILSSILLFMLHHMIKGPHQSHVSLIIFNSNLICLRFHYPSKFAAAANRNLSSAPIFLIAFVFSLDS